MIERSEVEALFGEWLSRIGNKELARKVVDAWMLGIERGRWESMEELKKMPFTLVTDPMGISFIEHTLAVTEGAVALAEAQIRNYGEKLPYRINMDRLIAGGLLHDVGKLLEIEPDGQGGWCRSRNGKCLRHPISGVVLGSEAGLPDDVLNTIGAHAREGENRHQVLETILIHQADFATFNPLVYLKNEKLITL